MPGKEKTAQEKYKERTVDPVSLVNDAGYSPEEAGLISRLVAAGLPAGLASVVVRDFIGTPKHDTPWQKYEAEHPYMAAAKKQLFALGGVAKGVAGKVKEGLTAPMDIQGTIEKEAARKMLKEYLMSRDREQAEESRKQNLWMIARMPGQPLFGQPIYTGPMTAPPNQHYGMDLAMGAPQVQNVNGMGLDIGPAQIQSTNGVGLDIGPAKIRR